MSAILAEYVTRAQRAVQWEEGWLSFALDRARDCRMSLERGMDQPEAGMAEWARQTAVLGAKGHLRVLRKMGWTPDTLTAQRLRAEGIL